MMIYIVPVGNRSGRRVSQRHNTHYLKRETCITTKIFSYRRNGPIFGVELTLEFLEIKNISRERFKSLVYGGVYRFCRTWSLFFSNVRL